MHLRTGQAMQAMPSHLYWRLTLALTWPAQEASRGERAAARILQACRQLMEECRASKDLDARSIAVPALGVAHCALVV